MSENFTTKSSGHFSGIPLELLYDKFVAEDASRGLVVELTKDKNVHVKTAIGEFVFANDILNETDVISIKVSALEDSSLYLLKEGLAENLPPEIKATLQWEDNIDEGAFPPNFRLVSVVSVTQLSPTFVRVRVSGTNLKYLATGPLHFRINLPPKGISEPQWPHMDANGKTVWPKGDMELHRPVYTIRWVDAEAGLMDFDVFIHEGGRVTQWACAAKTGDQIGITGPGGGSTVQANWMLIAGDETAYPAIARILENASPDSKGIIVLQGEADYPFPDHKGFEIEYVKRDSAASNFPSHLIGTVFPDAALNDDGGYVWIAAEKADIANLRAHFRSTLSLTKENSYIAVFWGATSNT